MTYVFRIENATVSVGCPPPCPCSSVRAEKWKTFQFHIHDFANLNTTKNHYVASPKFTCNGHQWELRVHPGGRSEAAEGQVSAYLHHLSSGSITTRFGFKIIDEFGNTKKIIKPRKKDFSGGINNRWGCEDFISRSVILDESKNILDSNGTLTVAVSVKEEATTVFVPKNSLLRMMGGLFNDENTADICFEVSSIEGKDKEGEKVKPKSSVSFYAHRWILEHFAPLLAAICGSNASGGVASASINDVKPDIFRHMLSYVYGGSVAEEELKTHAKDIIDAADKYSIVNLKLEAEAVYVQSVDITLDNTMDNLLYADSRNCALLKEAVMKFLADNLWEAAPHDSFRDFPPHCAIDLLIAVARKVKKDTNGASVDELATLSVDALRRKLDSLGLEVDGSREAMIESIKNNS